MWYWFSVSAKRRKQDDVDPEEEAAIAAALAADAVAYEPAAEPPPIREDAPAMPEAPARKGSPAPARRKGPPGGGRRKIAGFWHRLPGRGRVRTGIGSLFRLVASAVVLAATAWTFISVGHVLVPAAGGGPVTGLILQVKGRIDASAPVPLQIASRPSGATVVLDGEPVGVTPYNDRLPKGQAVEIELRLPGHPTWRRRLQVSGEGLAVDVDLTSRRQP